MRFKQTLGLVLALFFISSASYGQFFKKFRSKKKATEEVPSLANNHDSVSYALAYNFAAMWKSQGLDSMNADVAFLAIKAAFGKDSIMLDEEYMIATVQEAAKVLEEKQSKLLMQEGLDFLAENGKKPGITTTASGLQYEVLTMGSGDKPKATDQVTTHYEGRLIDGTVFDSSYKRGQPATFPLNGVIRGWTEALQLMPEGSKFRLYIPQELAYGPRGAGSMIKPYSTLIFDVELITIVK